MVSPRSSPDPHRLAPTEEEPSPTPELVDELRLVGVLSPDGKLIACRFQNPSGGSQTNVMAYNDFAPGAMIYQGGQDGFPHVLDIVRRLGNTDDYFAWVILINAQEVVEGVLSPGQRFVRLSLHGRDGTEIEVQPGYRAPTSRREIAAMVCPVNTRLANGPLPPGITATRIRPTFFEETDGHGDADRS